MKLFRKIWIIHSDPNKIHSNQITTQYTKIYSAHVLRGILYVSACATEWAMKNECTSFKSEIIVAQWRQMGSHIFVNNGLQSDHYSDVIMGTIASQITSRTIVYSTVYSDADQRKHHSSASLAFVWGIHRGPVNSPHKWSVTRKIFPFDDVIMSTMSLPDTVITSPIWMENITIFMVVMYTSSIIVYLWMIQIASTSISSGVNDIMYPLHWDSVWVCALYYLRSTWTLVM